MLGFDILASFFWFYFLPYFCIKYIYLRPPKSQGGQGRPNFFRRINILRPDLGNNRYYKNFTRLYKMNYTPLSIIYDKYHALEHSKVLIIELYTSPFDHKKMFSMPRPVASTLKTFFVVSRGGI